MQLSTGNRGDEASHDESQCNVVQRRGEQLDPCVVDGVHALLRSPCQPQSRQEAARPSRVVSLA